MTLFLNDRQVANLLDTDALLDVLADGFRAISAGAAVPARGELVVDGAGTLLTMPAHARGLPIATKLVTIFPGNTDVPSHMALIVLMDAATGQALAVMDGTHITAMRTAGAATLAAKLLARPDSRTLTIIGAGVQGQAHLELLSRHFDFERVFIGSPKRANAERLAASHPRGEVTDHYEAAVRQSDIVCLCTHAEHPVIRAEWVQPGQHISSVGYAPPGGELDPAIAAKHRLFVEAKVAFAPPPAGSAELAGIDPASAAELGEVLLDSKPGRTSPNEVTVYKAMGHAMEDLVVAAMIYRAAVARPTPPVGTAVQSVIVPADLSFEERVARGNYGWRHDAMIEADFPIDPAEAGDRVQKIYHFNRSVSSPEIIRLIREDGYEPAGIADILLFGELFPEVQQRHPVISMGAVVDVDGSLSVPALWFDGERRTLDLIWYDGDWHRNYRFLGVRRGETSA